VLSCASPSVSTAPMGSPTALQRRWTLVVKPPRERPSAWNRIPVFRRLRSDAPGSWCYRSSATRLDRQRCAPVPANMMSHTPQRHQRRYCRQTEFQLPNSSGRSRHGAPVRQIQRIPSSAWRWLHGGRPPCDEGLVRNGSMSSHSSSVIRPRSTANLPVERLAPNHTAPHRGIGLRKKR
jgi:hypothetical protein